MSEDQRHDHSVSGGSKKRLKGDEKNWHLIALRLGKSVGEAKSIISATEYLRWLRFFEEEPNEFNSLHWYLAALCKKVEDIPFQIFGKPEGLGRTIEDNLINFRTKTDKPEVKAVSMEEIERQYDSISASSIQTWKQVTGVDKSPTQVGTPRDQNAHGDVSDMRGTPRSRHPQVRKL